MRLPCVEIIEKAICPDHVHMLVGIPPKISVSVFGVSEGKFLDDFLISLNKYKFGNRNFGRRVLM